MREESGESAPLCVVRSEVGPKARPPDLCRQRRLLGIVVLACVSQFSYSQITQIRPVDIGAGIANGKVHVVLSPSTGADSTKPFDGNPFTEMAILSGESLQVTLQFDTLARIEKSKVFIWNEGKWKLEAADFLSDLNSRSGTYSVLTDSNAFASFAWDSISFSPRNLRVVRLTARNPQGSGVYLGEWTLEGAVTFTKLALLPSPLRVMTGTTLQINIMIMDEQTRLYPNFLKEPLDWQSGNIAIARVEQDGKVTGISPGTTTITARTDANTISGQATVSVEQDFKADRVAPMSIKVGVVYQDPVLQNSNRIHEEFRLRDPRLLVPALVKHFREATDSVVNFQVVEAIDASILFTRLKGTYLTVPQYVQLLNEPGWTTLKAASDSGQLKFDYKEFVKYYKFDEKRNNGQIDEVWVFAAPYLGMWESQLMGPNAFWWNSYPIRDGTALKKLLSVMGLNYERGVDQAFHSFGHRAESAMQQAYLDAQHRQWAPTSTNPTPWDLFTRYDMITPGKAHVGKIHFPPNGVRDYDYGNPALVISYAENWYRYPYLFEQSRQVNISSWYYSPGEPLAEGLDHLGYLRWWYGHLPRYTGITDGVLNNWWHYVLDYEGAVKLAQSTPVLSVDPGRPGQPEGFRLEQNYPNPFNPTTMIKYTVGGLRVQGLGASNVKLVVYDVLGREVAVLVNEQKPAGMHEFQFDASALSSGVYLYRLTAGQYVAAHKMLLIK